MPKINEAAVVAAGLVVGVESVTEFGTDKHDGVKVLIATQDGYASVKLNVDRERELRPDFGHQVAWWVRYGATYNRERQSDAQTYSSFVGVVTDSDVQKLLGITKTKSQPATQAA